MGTATDYFENIALDAILGDNKGATVPSTVYVGLLVTSPDDGGGGDEVSSVGTGYARVSVTNNTANWPAAFGSIKTNGAVIQFPTALSAWGDVGWVGIYDSSSSGNMLLSGQIASPVSPIAGNAPYFDVGGLTVTCD